MNNYLKRVLATFVILMATMPIFADIEVWNIGKLQAVVESVEDNEAGKVFVSPVELTSEDQIAAVDGFYQTEPYMLTAPNAYSQETRMTWFYYAKANPGYTFKGFVTTKTGTPSATALDNLVKVGDFYQTSGKTSACGARPQDNPVPLARYAVFEKTATGEEGGEGGEDPVLTNIKAIGALYPKTTASVDSEGYTTGVVTYENLVGATLVANGGETFQDGDQVTHIYVKFDAELADITMTGSMTLADQLSLVNTTNGQVLNFNRYSCKVWDKDNTALDLMLSSEDYINNLDYQGVYEFKLPAGVVKSAKGAVNDAYEFTFTYGDPSAVETPTEVNLDDYLGNWKQMKEAGEDVENPGAFSIVKIDDAYYMTNLYASSLQIPLSKEGDKFFFANTNSGNESFVSALGTSVEALFVENNGQKGIGLGQFTITSSLYSEPVVGGNCFFEKTNEDIPTAIINVNAQTEQSVFDLQGRRLSAPVKGVNIVNGKKYIVK